MDRNTVSAWRISVTQCFALGASLVLIWPFGCEKSRIRVSNEAGFRPAGPLTS
jgi:hypothetical protein